MTKTFVEEFIPEMGNINKVYEFFRESGYNTLKEDFKISPSTFNLRKQETEFIESINLVSNYEKNFGIYLIKLNRESQSVIRSFPELLHREIRYSLAIFTHNFINYTFALIESQRIDVGTFKQKLTRLNFDITDLKYTDALLLKRLALNDENIKQSEYFNFKNISQLSEIKANDIFNYLTKDVFNVEKVTKRFFEEYIELFKKVRDFFIKQSKDIKWSHEYSLQLLNRIMFMYFVQKKKWLDDNPKFLKYFWKTYLETKTNNEFYDKWLSVLFFEAFNNKFYRKSYFSKDLNAALALAPYLNGGLFEYNKLDEKLDSIPDSLFDKIFEFFERYNFTIREELPLEIEVAVDPEMIGKVYETLVNISETIDERGEAGIFYTSRVEIDFMCRRSLVEYFHNQITGIEKDIWYDFIFARMEGEKLKIDAEITKHRLWEKIENALDDLSVVDPTCGSGSFLVGMLIIISDLYKRAYAHLNRDIDDFDLKKGIIGRSLYGVDVMEWAVHIAELRLWLQLIVETELKQEQLKSQPLLPNLSFKIRQGDSLVQEIGGINLAIRTGSSDISQNMKRKLTMLKNEKLKFYNNEQGRKFRTEEQILKEELNVFREVLDEKVINIKNQIKKYSRQIEETADLFGRNKSKQTELLEKEYEKQKENLLIELEKVQEAKSALINVTDKPFVWDIDFAEIFSDEKKGFDIVIGNPPYVRQEKIADPSIPKDKITTENKKIYKEKLAKSVKAIFGDKAPQKIDMKSDLYIYFYFHGLNLLNNKGTFCFITSNSWLDVGYGKDLQRFLLENCHIKSIYDNSAKRSFSEADINTIITIFSAPTLKKEIALKKDANFVCFKLPFEEVISGKNLKDIENYKENVFGNEYRLYKVNQEKLLSDGWEYPEYADDKKIETFKFNIGKYSGNKWGGKYLRAPDIYYTILEKGKGKLIHLGELTDIRFGIKTGCNEFFYLDNEKIKEWKIEKEFLKLIIKSPRECKSIIINQENLKYKIFMCHKTKSELKGTNALKYIEWGEKQKSKDGIRWCKVPSVSGRKKWYDLGEQKTKNYLWSRGHNDSHRIYECNIYSADTFSVLYPIKNYLITGAILNSTFTWFMKELFGRTSLGEGGLGSLGIDLVNIEIINIEMIPEKIIQFYSEMKYREIDNIFNELNLNSLKPIRDQKPNPLLDRKKLDDIIFDILGLTEEERNEVYWSVCELVKNRLDKARSV
jgi:gas vesicle protein